MSVLKEYVGAFESLETPFYFYDIGLLKNTINQVKRHIDGYPFHVHYALKANVNRRLLQELKLAGFGADCVSGNEVKRALESGFSRDDIVFAGVGKTDREIEYGIMEGIYAFNVESFQELEVLNEIAGKLGRTARFAMRINPNVDAETHKYITTGTRENKFGITVHELYEAVDRIPEMKNVEFSGLHFHIGSQIVKNEKFADLSLKANELQSFLFEKGFDLKDINVGGGLGIDYENPDSKSIPDFRGYFDAFKKHLELRDGQKVHFELGRSLVGQCGSLIAKVLYTKPGEGKSFLILDAGMTELIRPALYQAYHHVENLTSNEDETALYDVVGPICETSDAFVRNHPLPLSSRGNLIAIRSSGAYAEVMSSRYNLREVAPSIFSDELSTEKVPA